MAKGAWKVGAKVCSQVSEYLTSCIYVPVKWWLKTARFSPHQNLGASLLYRACNKLLDPKYAEDYVSFLLIDTPDLEAYFYYDNNIFRRCNGYRLPNIRLKVQNMIRPKF